MMSKLRMNIIFLAYSLIAIAVSYVLVHFTQIEILSVFNVVSLFTYFGVLIGFALTIYTFGLSMIGDIKSNISKLEQITEDKKKEMYSGLRMGFQQIKENIWLIFIGIILVVVMSVLKDIPNPFGWKVAKYQIPDIVNLTMFILATVAMYDIMKTMFNLSEINMELIKEENLPS